MIVNIIIIALVSFFVLYDLYSACRSFIGHNPNAPSLLARLKAWWPGFVKRHIVDDAPEIDESHAITRYHHCEQCGESDGNGRPGGSCCVQCLDDEIEALR